MVHAPQTDHTILRSRRATVDVEYVDLDHARLTVDTERYGPGAREAAALVCEAVCQARARHVHHLETALEASAPACCLILEALRTRSGGDLEGMELRRAGSSVMVSLDVRPWQTPSLETDLGRVGLIPTQPGHRVPRHAKSSPAPGR